MFDARKHMIKVQGRQYLPVSARLLWFRGEHPDWAIETEAIALDLERQCAIFRATIRNEAGRVIATGTKFEDVAGFPDYIEKAETGAVGRALALCGYGTQHALDARGDAGAATHIVDAPVSRPAAAPALSVTTSSDQAAPEHREPPPARQATESVYTPPATKNPICGCGERLTPTQRKCPACVNRERAARQLGRAA